MAEPKPLENLTHGVIGAAMRVHNALGPGLKEAVYQNALSLEMERAGLSFQAEQPVEIFLDGSSIGLLYLDHLVEGQLVVEEKAISHLLTKEEIAQVITYLCATGLRSASCLTSDAGDLNTSASSRLRTSSPGEGASNATSGIHQAPDPLIR